MSAEPALSEAPERKLAELLIEVALEVEEISKDRHNAAQNYDFVSADNMIGTLRMKLLSRGVLLLAAEDSMDERARQTRQGSETSITTVHIDFVFLHARTGERIELRWPGRGEDPMDKGVGKALTNALKTFLRQQFLLPYGDDPEADEGSDERAYGKTVNLIEKAKGLRDEQLNQALVAVGLPAQAKPFGAFTRVPDNVAPQLAARLEALHAA